LPLLLFLSLAMISVPAHAATSPVLLDGSLGECISVAQDGTPGNGSSFCGSVSSGGWYVIFYSQATNILPGCPNGGYFLRDRTEFTTSFLSSNWSYASITGDGQHIIFGAPGTANGCEQLYIRGRTSGQAELVSVTGDGTQANGQIGDVSASPDGRFTAFDSDATNLVSGVSGEQVYVRDRGAGTMECVSVTSDGTQGNGSSYCPSISADGRFVAFQSYATNLVPGITNGQEQVYVRDRSAGVTQCVSLAPDGTQGNNWSGYPSISADGRYVGFTSEAGNLVCGGAYGYEESYMRDRTGGSTVCISWLATGGCCTYPGIGTAPVLSADGRYLLFEYSYCYEWPSPWDYHLFLYDQLTNMTTSVDLTYNSRGWLCFGGYGISTDGRYLVYNSGNVDDNNYSPVGSWQSYILDQYRRGAVGIVFNTFTLTPNTIDADTDVSAQLSASGAAHVNLRVQGLRRDFPAIAMNWNGSVWSATIPSALAAWASGGCLTVFADIYDSAGNFTTVSQVLEVAPPACPVTTGVPNYLNYDASNGYGLLTGSSKILSSGLQLREQLNVQTNSPYGGGPLNIWPAICYSGVPASPEIDPLNSAWLCNRCTPVGGAEYSATFYNVGDTETFSASMDATAYSLSVADALAHGVAAFVPGFPDIAPATMLSTLNDLMGIKPVAQAVGEFNPLPSVNHLPAATKNAAVDIFTGFSEASSVPGVERLLEDWVGSSGGADAGAVFHSSMNILGQIGAAWSLGKEFRDIITWNLEVPNNNAVVQFTAEHSATGLRMMAMPTFTDILSGSATTVTYSLSGCNTNYAYNFTLNNDCGNPIWEWRIHLDPSLPFPTSVTAPSGWTGEIVQTVDGPYVRWYTQGPNGWSSGDYGNNTIPEPGSLGGFTFNIPGKIAQCAYTFTDTDMLANGDMLLTSPGVIAAPTTFSPSLGDIVYMSGYLDRPAAASLQVCTSGGTAVATLWSSSNAPAGCIAATWNGTDSSGNAQPVGSYEAKLTINYQDGDSDTEVVPITLAYENPPTIAITSPSVSSITTRSATIIISGTAQSASGIDVVTWSNNRGWSGTCSGSSSWSQSAIPLAPGTNVITATAVDNLGHTASAALTVTDTHPVVQGKITLQNYPPSTAGITGAVELQDSAGNILEKHPITLDSAGSYSFITTLTGSYTACAKCSHWLAKAMPVTISSTGAGTVNFTLINGDINGDNFIEDQDYSLLGLAWYSGVGDANYNVNADLNGDGFVEDQDYSIMGLNWYASGDPF